MSGVERTNVTRMPMTTNEAPFCECGCGERVRSRSHGIWSRWRAGHNTRPTPCVPDPSPVIGMQLSMLPDIPEVPLPYGAGDDE